MSEPTYAHTFTEGCMWEGGSWHIDVNHEGSAHGGGEPCKHCRDIHDKVHTRSWEDSTWTERVWTIPRVVIAFNEGGYNSTGVCLDCILEAAGRL